MNLYIGGKIFEREKQRRWLRNEAEWLWRRERDIAKTARNNEGTYNG